MESPKFDLRKLSKGIKKALIYDEDIINKRWDLCKDCEFLLFKSNCKKCGCFMKAKVRVASASCPLNPPKWDKEYDFIKGKKVNAS